MPLAREKMCRAPRMRGLLVSAAADSKQRAAVKSIFHRFAIAAVLFAAFPSFARAQGDAPARIKSRSELVVVPVTAKDKSGNLVADLRQEEFRILEDGVEQKVVLFSAEPFPLSAVVLIDNDLSVKTAQEVQRSLLAIAGGFGPNDEVALMRYDMFPETVTDFTSDNDQVFTQLKRMRVASDFPGQASSPMTSGPKVNSRSAEPRVPILGATPPPGAVTVNLTDAVYAAGQLLRSRGRDRRKIIFIVSDGSNSHHNKMSYEDTIQLLLTGDISVYAVSVGPPLWTHEVVNILSKFANATGGDFFTAAKENDLERLYARITEQARTQYTLAFVPRAPNPSKDFHSIEVRVKRSDLDLLARQGYYSTTPH